MDDIRQIRGYILQRQIGEGGFGKVYLAYQEFIQRFVAIKIVHNRYSNQPDFIRRFDAEARIIARLEHPHIVPLYDYWRDTTGSYLVMRLLQGGNLRDIISERRLTLGEIAQVVRHLCDALEAAHDAKVVHHDIKPENILVDTIGNAYLTDFGIAIDLTESKTGETHYNVHYGSIDYSAPERIRDRSVSTSSDIYSIGIMLYELLAGELPFPDGTDAERRERYLHTPIPSIVPKRNDVSETLMSVIWKATAKRSDIRYQTVAELRSAVLDSLDNPTPKAIKITNETDQQADALKTISTNNKSSSTDNDTAILGNQNKQSADPLATGALGGDSLATGKFALPNASNINADPLATGALGDDSLDTGNVSFGYLSVNRFAKKNPYRGLQAFYEADSGNFFGREEAIKSLLTKLQDKQLLVLAGPSGSGKSSLINAGLLPELRDGALLNSEKWFVTRMQPGNDPYQQMVDALESVALYLPSDALEQIKNDTFALYQIVESMLPDDETKLLLIIDQFEELFTLNDDKAFQREFLQMLHDTIDKTKRFVLVITLRADFYDRPLSHPEFGTKIREQTEFIVALKPNEMEEVIRRPAANVGLDVEQRLVDTLVEEAYGEQGMLPLLQFALSEVYNYTDGLGMTYDAYEAVGGLSGALANRANQIYNGLSDEEKEDAKRLFLLLININRDSAPTRSRQNIRDLLQYANDRERFNKVINQFTSSRLLTVDRDAMTRLPTVEISHEAIIEGWKLLRSWIEGSMVDLQRQARLRDATNDWIEQNRDVSYLARGSQLIDFEALYTSSSVVLSDVQRDYLQASIEQSQWRQRQQRIFMGVLIGLTILAFGLMFAALDRQRRAVQASAEAAASARTARSRELAALSQANLNENDLALLLSIEAVRTTNTYEARNMLLSSLQTNPRLERFVHQHDEGIRTLNIDRDIEVVTTGAADGSIIATDLVNDTMIYSIPDAHSNAINAITSQANGNLWASGGNDATVNLWRGNDVINSIDTDSNIWSLAFAPNGDYLLMGLTNGDIAIWDIEDETLIDPLEAAHNGIVYDITFSPDGDVFATGGEDSLIRIWDAETLEPIGEPLESHNNWVLTLKFHPLGQLLASGDANGEVILWNWAAGEPLQRLNTGFQAFVRSLDFSIDGQLLAVSSSTTNRVHLWNLTTGERLSDLDRGHIDGIWAVNFDPSTGQLISASADGSAILWTLSLPFRPALAVHPSNQVVESITTLDNRIISVGGDIARPQGFATVWDADFTERLATIRPETQTLDFVQTTDNTIVLASRSNNLIWVYDAESYEERFVLDGHVSFVTDIALRQSDNTLISADIDGTVIHWDLETGAEVNRNRVEESDGITSVTLHSTRDLIAIGTLDGSIRLWDLSTLTRRNDPIAVHEEAVTDLVFHPILSTLYSASRDQSIIEWSFGDTMQAEAVLTGHTDWILEIVMSPDNRSLISAGLNGEIRIWDLATERPIGSVLQGHSDRVTSVLFADNGNLLSSSRDTLIIEWAFNPEQWTTIACAVANRNLTDAEWSRYFAEEAYRAVCE